MVIKWCRQLFRSGDINAFFGLAIDNMTNLVILSAVLTGVFGMPKELVLTKMLPGSAVGVLVGDLLYSLMAWRLARRTGREDVTAMPLGLDTPSTFGLSFGLLGPTYLLTKDPVLTWQTGMATLVLMGIFKLALSFSGPLIRRIIPRAALLGSIAGVALLLIAYLPVLRLFSSPVVGLISLGIVLVTLLARYRFPFGIPGALAGIAIGSAAHYLLGWGGLLPQAVSHAVSPFVMHPALPLPSLDFLPGLGRAVDALPLALPFALATVVGGVDVTESAAVAGDDYNTRDILLVEGGATLIAGLCGGVIQSCPYIGHPAYKEMGGRSGYTIATGIFIGVGGMLGILSTFVSILPEAAVAPILLFIGIEITAQAFEATPDKQHRAVVITFIPAIACLVGIVMGQMLGSLGRDPATLEGELKMMHLATMLLGNGFIVTALLWGSAVSFMLEHRLVMAAIAWGACVPLTLSGLMHSPLANGALFSPLAPPFPIVWHLAAGYGAISVLMLLLSRCRGSAS